MKTKVALFYHDESIGVTASHPYGEIISASVGSRGMIGEVGVDLITNTIDTSDLASVMKNNPGLSSPILDWALSRQLEPFSNWENI